MRIRGKRIKPLDAVLNNDGILYLYTFIFMLVVAAPNSDIGSDI